MKYIIELEDEPYMREDGVNYYTCKSARWYKLGETIINRLTPYTEPDRKAIEDEVWGFAWEVLQLDLPVFRKIFGYDTDKMDYRDYKYKYEAWKKLEDEIKIGDEVEYESCGEVVKFIVTGVNGSRVYGFKSPCEYDDVGEYCDIDGLHKTGRHFPEVAELLEKMRGES